MELFVIRHAKAADRDPEAWPDDSQRPLTREGAKEFERVARRIREWRPAVDMVLSSGFVRAWDTARILSDQADWPAPVSCPELAAHASVGEALGVLMGLPNDGTIVCVGHEPNLTLLAQALLRAKDAGEVPWFKKGGALCVRFRGTVEPRRGKLHWARAPKELRRVGS